MIVDSLQKINALEWERRREGRAQKYRLKDRYKIAHDRLVRFKPKTWADIGAGNGFLAEVVKPDLPDVHVTGLDFAEEPLSSTDVMDKRIVANLDESGLPFEDSSLDYLTCLEVLEHLILPEKMLHEMVRVLKPGGRVLISVPNLQFIEYLLALSRGKMPHPAADPRHMSIFTIRFLKRRMREAGFRITHVAGCDASPSFLAHVSRRFLCKTILVEGARE